MREGGELERSQRMLYRIFFILFTFMAIISQSVSATDGNAPLRIYAISSYEAHTQDNNGNDFFYTGFVATREVRKDFAGIVSYIHKYDLTDKDTKSHIGNISFSNVRNEKFTIQCGYSYYNNPGNSGPGNSGKFLAMGIFKLSDTKLSSLNSYTSYSTASDFSEYRSLNQKIKYKRVISDAATLSVYGQYSYNLNYEENLFNLYGVDVSYALKKKLNLNAGYIFMDSRISGVGDDNIFKIGLQMTVY